MQNHIILQEENFNKLKNKVKENKGKNIVFTSNKDDLNRKVLEKLNINILLINQAHRKDKPRQRDSGFNQVLARIAKKNNISIGINLDEIINASLKEKSKILARIKQNIQLCNKKKIKMKFISKKSNRNIYDLKSLGLILGMPTWMTKDLQ